MTALSPLPPRAVLLATDLSSRCDRALDRAIGLARQWQARLVVVSVLPPLEQHELSEELFGQADWGPSLSPQAYAQRRLQRDLDGRADGIEVVLRLQQGPVGPGIIQVAAEEDCGLILTGLARDAIFEQPRLGSTVLWLARHSPVPVLLVRNRQHNDYRTMVLANDHSAHSQRALETALGLFGEPLQLSLYMPWNCRAPACSPPRLTAWKNRRGVAPMPWAGSSWPPASSATTCASALN